MTLNVDTVHHIIQGRTVSLPVQIHHARQWATSWLVPAPAAQTMIDYSGLEVVQPLPGRAMFTIAFVDYIDGDLDAYHEVAFSFLVRPHDASPAISTRDHLVALKNGEVAAFIHDLPVDQEFTREAGTTIWGYPKWIAQIDLTRLSKSTACGLSTKDGHQFQLLVRDRGQLPFPKEMPPTYSWRDGILRRTEWTISTKGGTSRIGGARISLGSSGPIVQMLRQLRLPKHALMTSVTPHLSSTFGAPETIHDW